MLYYVKGWADEHETVLGVFDDTDKIERYLKKHVKRFDHSKTLEYVSNGKYKIKNQNDGEDYHFWIELITINKGI